MVVAMLLIGIVAAHLDVIAQNPDSFHTTPEQPVSSMDSVEKQGDLYMARKFFKEASETYTKAIASDPRNFMLYNKLGIAYHQALKYNPAKKAYRKAIQLNPRYAPAVNNLAAVEYSQKHYKNAVKTYQQALKLTPNDAVIYSNMGTAYFAMKKFQDAVTSYKTALSLDPEIFEHSSRTGNIVHQRDEKNSAEFNFYMAKSYADLKDVDNAVLYLRKAWEEGYKNILTGLKDKSFEFLADQPAFVELVTQVQAAEEKKSAQAR
jgi:tetratricopeptide (TPR) repeat protein